MLERIRALARGMADGRIAEILNAEGLATRMGLPWTKARVYRIRQNHGVLTGCPTMPKESTPRGDGLVPLGVAADLLGVVRTALGHWHKSGFLQVEQRGAGSPLWVELTGEEIDRLDGTMAARGYGQWRVREAQRVLGLTKEQLREKARQGEVVAYRAHIGDHWEWRVSLAERAQPSASDESSPG